MSSDYSIVFGVLSGLFLIGAVVNHFRRRHENRLTELHRQIKGTLGTEESPVSLNDPFTEVNETQNTLQESVQDVYGWI